MVWPPTWRRKFPSTWTWFLSTRYARITSHGVFAGAAALIRNVNQGPVVTSMRRIERRSDVVGELERLRIVVDKLVSLRDDVTNREPTLREKVVEE